MGEARQRMSLSTERENFDTARQLLMKDLNFRARSPMPSNFSSTLSCVSRRNFVRILSASAGSVLVPPAIASARLTRHGNPDVVETLLSELGRSWLTANRS